VLVEHFLRRLHFLKGVRRSAVVRMRAQNSATIGGFHRRPVFHDDAGGKGEIKGFRQRRRCGMSAAVWPRRRQLFPPLVLLRVARDAVPIDGPQRFERQRDRP
jgi:hypothetical protein